MSRRHRGRSRIREVGTVDEGPEKSAGRQAAEDVATVAAGVGVLSFAGIGCVGGALGAFGVGSVIGAIISPWTLLAVPVVGYGLWRWQRHRLECRIDPTRHTVRVK